MLEGYRPLDLSSILPQLDLSAFAQQPKRNRLGMTDAAMKILANSEFSGTPLATLRANAANGLTTEGEAPPRKQTLWGRAVDLLSTPVYGIANAVDDAIAGHQSDSSDSVLHDIGQVIGGTVTGAGRGVGAGLRGAFAGGESAANPEDKIYLDDPMIRMDLGMSPKDAAKPENRELVRARLKTKIENNKVNDLSSLLFSQHPLRTMELENGDLSDEAIDEYFRSAGMSGFISSAVTDPVNLINAPGKFVRTPTAELAPSTKAENLKSALGEGPKNILGPKMPGSPSSYRVEINPGSVQNAIVSPSGDLIKPPDWFNFPKSANEMVPEVKALVTPPVINEFDPVLDQILIEGSSGSKVIDKAGSKLTPVAKAPDHQIALANDLTKNEAMYHSKIMKALATGDFQAIPKIFPPGVPIPEIEKFVQVSEQIPNFSKHMALPASRAKIAKVLTKALKDQSNTLKRPTSIIPASQILNDAEAIGPVASGALLENAGKAKIPPSKNPARDAEIATRVIDEFTEPIVGSGTPSGMRNPAAWTSKVNAKVNTRWSGPQQVQMYNKIGTIVSKEKNIPAPQRFAVTANILRQVEDHFINLGAKPMSHFLVNESSNLRLSQVLDVIGPAAAAMNPKLMTKILAGDPEVLAQLPAQVVQRLEELKAAEALVDSGPLIQGVNAGQKTLDEIIKNGPLSAGREQQVTEFSAKVAQDITARAGGSPVAQRAAFKEFTTKNPIDSAIKSNSLNTKVLISHPEVSASLIARYSSAPSITRAIQQMSGLGPPAVLGRLVGPSAGVVDWLGARFNAAYKNADMRPIYLREAATAKSSVARRADYLNELARKYDVNNGDLWNDAMKGAQGLLPPVAGSTTELSKEIMQIMENLFTSSGLKTGIALENSVVGRAQLFMGELNKNMVRFGLGKYKFKMPEGGSGPDWLKAWEAWEIDKPLDFLFKIQNVVEHTTREKLMFDDIIARYGVLSPGNYRAGVYRHVQGHPRLAGYKFGKDAAEQIDVFVKNLKEISKPSSKAMQMFDNVLSKWKASVTIYVPSHHMRNLIGDTYMNWVAGVDSTRPYSTSLNILKSQKGRYEGLDEVADLTSADALKNLMGGGGASTPAGKRIALTMKNGQHLTNDEVYVSAFQQGILPTTRVLEDIPDDAASVLNRVQPFGGNVRNWVHGFSESRDHYVRLAHYVDALKKSNKPFAAAQEDAARIVRKWHPDGMDLTAFERNVMRRAFPFYSWTRKAIPLIVESLALTPGKTMVYPKAQYLAQLTMGTQGSNMSDPFPYDQLFPDWLREKGIGPTSGGPGSYGILNPSNPTLDIVSQLNDPGKMTMGMVNPAVRIPFELATGQEATSGAPITGHRTDYAIKQIPGLSHLGRATGEFGVSDTTKEQSQGYNMQNIINLITALGKQNTGPYQKSGEFDLRNFIKEGR